MSKKAKVRFSNKENHPFFGKHHSEKTKNKIRESNSITWSNKIIEGNSIKSCYYKTGYVFSEKMNKNIYYRSSYEKIFIHFIDACDDILSFEEEPFHITYTHKNKKLRYIPDFLIKFKDKTHLIEIKPEKLKCKSKNQDKFRSAKKYIKHIDIDEFFVLDKNEFFKYILLFNNKFTSSFMKKLMTAINDSYAVKSTED